MNATTERRRLPYADWKEAAFPVAKSMARQSLSFAAGLLFSRGIVFSQCAPFGVAAVAAVPQNTVWAAMLGAVFGYFLPGNAWVPARYLVAVIAAAAIRWTLSDLLKLRGHPVFAPLVALLPILTTGLAVTSVSGSSAHTVLLTAAEAIFGGGSAFFMARTAAVLSPPIKNAESGRGEKTLVSQDAACIVLTAGIALLCLSGTQIGSFSPAHVLAVVGILFAASYGGPAGGSIAGVASGVFFSLATSGISYLSAGYAMGGLTAGLFSSGGRLASAAAFVICHGVAALQAGNLSLALTGMYEVMAATVLFLLLPERAGQTAVRLLRREEDPLRSDALRRMMTHRLDRAAHALGDVSRSVAEVSEKLAQTEAADVRSVYEKISGQACRSCGMYPFCWEKERESTMSAFQELTPVLRRGGTVYKEDFSEWFASRCARIGDVCEAVNRNYDEFAFQEEAERRAGQIRELVADQFVTVGGILESMAGDLELYDRFDPSAARKASDVFRDAGLQPMDISCRIDRFGRMVLEAEVARFERLRIHKGELVRRISQACGRSFAVPVFHPSKNGFRIVMAERSRYRAKTGVAQHVCGNGSFCGDSYELFTDENGRQYAVISDGMGTGGRAAVDGIMASGILSRLIQAGIQPDAALRIVNAALMVKSGEESLATLDVCTMDLFTGEAEFAKAGAPVSLLRHKGEAAVLEAPSLPAGILREVRFSQLNQSLEEGDLVVLLSDGAVASGTDWLLEELQEWEDGSPQDLADHLTNLAVQRRDDGRDDDITVIVLELSARRER